MTEFTLLKNVPIFSGLPEDIYTDLTRLLKDKSFKKGDVVCSHDEAGDSLFIIKKGSVKVTLYNESGKEIILSILKAGDFFGEMSLLDSEPRSANVIATENADLLVLRQREFLSYIIESPKLTLKMLKVMTKRLRLADEQIGNLALLDVNGRIARYLIQLAKNDGIAHEEGLLVKKRPTHQDIAGIIGTSRETVSRALSGLQKRGLIDMFGKAILIRHIGLAEVDEKYSF
ncbi:MAG: Crp/Fnr family transcriptional regulator [Pseudomonadota bacterium]